MRRRDRAVRLAEPPPADIAGLAAALAAAAKATGSSDLQVLMAEARRARRAYCAEHGCWRYRGLKDCRPRCDESGRLR